jgi:predicted RecB family nuclease/REP element-mobilizing transposase RayT
MDKSNIISYWSYEKSSDKNKTHDYIVNKLAKFYSDLNNIDLVNLNLLNESFNYFYWFICRKTGELYFINLIINNREYQLAKDMIQALSEVNRYVFKQINFEIEEVDIINNPGNYIYTFTISSEDNKLIKQTTNFIVNNIELTNKSVININKPSRTIRYIRRQILMNCNKRQREDDSNDLQAECNAPIKRKKVENNINWEDMISASSVRNYLLNDPLLDYLKEYNIRTIDESPSRIPNLKTNMVETSSPDIFTKHIMDAGIDFEEELFKIIKREHPIVKVAEYFQAKSQEKFDETINLMKQGVPIIYQGVLHNFDNKTFGLPDLMIRSDYINKLMGYKVIDDKEATIKSSKLGIDWHYKIVDIKHSNIPLRADGIHILNSESIPAYKGQLYIYTHALNKIQGININKAFIWGKKYFWESKSVKYERIDFLNKLGIIDYDSVDYEYVNQTNDAIKWIQMVRTEGTNWKLLPVPSRAELFPNMKNEKDGHWRKIKNELNEKINEITSVIYCGVKHRQTAHQSHVYKWTDPKCTAKIMGFNTKGKQSIIVDSVLNINRQVKDIIRPEYINWDRINWYNHQKDQLEFYLDFETLNSNFGSIIKDGIISYNSNQYIFMIGIGYISNNNWVFKTFIMNEKSDESEVNMFNEFYKYVNDTLRKNKKRLAKFYHWSGAEPLAYKSFKNRNSDIQFKDEHFIFYDLYKVFISEPIVVKGALNFSLKTIAKALKKYSMIETCWNQSSPCSNGLTAMILANKIYENNTINNEQPIGCVQSNTVMKEIAQYNEVDCKVMYEIHELMRNNL